MPTGRVSVYEMDEIVSLVRSIKPRIVLLASPNNPTGNSFPPNDVKLLLQECADTMIVVDEAYFGFADSPDDGMPRRTLQHPNLAVLRTFSNYTGSPAYESAMHSWGKIIRNSSRTALAIWAIIYCRNSLRLPPFAIKPIINHLHRQRRKSVNAIMSFSKRWKDAGHTGLTQTLFL